MKEMINNDKRKENILTLLYTFIIFPLLGENLISTMCNDSVSKVLSIISCILILAIVIKKGNVHMDKFLYIILILIVQHTIINFLLAPKSLKITTANSMITPYGLMGYFMLFLLINTYIKDRILMKTLFKSMTIIMTLCVLANFIFTADLHIANNIEVFKEAISTGYTNSRQWLFGHRNMIFIHHLIWILVSYLYYKLSKKKYFKMYIVQIIFTVIVGIVSWNSTMILTTMILIILRAFRKNKISKIITKNYLAVYLALEIGIVFFRVQDMFSFIIVGILHRNLTFTGRTYIWNYYINQFVNNDIFNKMLGNFGITELTVNTHNMFLGLMSFTGLIGLMLYLILLYITSKKLKSEQNDDNANFITMIIFSFLINSLTMEFYLQPLIAMYMGYKIKEINLLVKGEN